MFTEN